MREPTQALEAVLAHMPYAVKMGLRIAALEAGGLVCHLPFKQFFIGNQQLPALHGGVLSSFMEIAATLEVTRRQLAHMDNAEMADLRDIGASLPVPLNVTVQYLRSGNDADCWVHAEVLKLGRRSSTAVCRMWQGDENKLVASMTGVFVSRA